MYTVRQTNGSPPVSATFSPLESEVSSCMISSLALLTGGTLFISGFGACCPFYLAHCLCLRLVYLSSFFSSHLFLEAFPSHSQLTKDPPYVL
jgi:hypothetical protein